MHETIRFREISERAERRGKCPTCGKTTRRARTFAETVSPFNKNGDGQPKTPAEVRESVRAKAEAWAPDPSLFEHDRCMDARAEQGGA